MSSSSKTPADPAARQECEPECRPSPSSFGSLSLRPTEPGRPPAEWPVTRPRSGWSNHLPKREIDDSSEISFSSSPCSTIITLRPGISKHEQHRSRNERGLKPVTTYCDNVSAKM